jgi:hypothetical protein
MLFEKEIIIQFLLDGRAINIIQVWPIALGWIRYVVVHPQRVVKIFLVHPSRVLVAFCGGGWLSTF